MALVYRKTLSRMVLDRPSAERIDVTAGPSRPAHQEHRGDRVITVALFFAGQPIALVALVAAGVLMLDRVRPEKVYRSVDWPLLVMFAGLFVVVHAFEVNVVQTWGLERWDALLESPVVLVSGLSVLLSNLVSNVPAVLLFKPLMEVMPQKELAWLALAMSSTLAGNLTVLGSVANLIVVENARRGGDRAELRGIPQGRRPADRADDARRRRLAGAGSLLRVCLSPRPSLSAREGA